MRETFTDWADLLKALADPTRLHILAILSHGPHCVCELVAALGVAQPTVSHHLARLRLARLVEEDRRGQWVYYRLNAECAEFVPHLLKALPDVTREVKAVAEDTTLACHVDLRASSRLGPPSIAATLPADP